MNILIDATGITEKPGGVGRYSYHLLRELADDHKNFYRVLVQAVLPPTHPVWQLSSERFHIIPAKISSIGPKRQAGFVRWYSHMDVDIFHCLNSFAPLLHRYPMVITIHDIKYLKYPAWLSGKSHLKSGYLKLSTKLGAKKAKRIIAVSQSTKHDLVKVVGVPANKIDVIYEAADTFSGDMESDENVLDIYALKKPYILFLGEKRPHKNIEGLLQAFAVFKKKYDKWGTHLVITGRQYADYQNYLDQTQELSLSGTIHYTGMVPDVHLCSLYANAELFILPSFYEGFGLPILEAMQYGTPVITSNTSSMPEVAGDAALLIDPGQPGQIATMIFRVMRSPQLRSELIQKGFRNVQKFSWKQTANATIDVYNTINKS